MARTTQTPPGSPRGIIPPELLLHGYRLGVFPMGMREGHIEWFSPDPRAILPLQEFKIPHGLRRTLAKRKFEVRINAAFGEVMRACADREETWINAELEGAMLALHQSGHAHSIEVRSGGELVGGLYGVKLGRAFFGESMFSRTRDTSKIALAWLVARLQVGNFTLLDCQFMTEHLASLGAISVPRDTYVALLSGALGGGSAAAGALAESFGRTPGAAPDFLALDRLLELAGAAGAAGPAGYVISQLLGQTS